MAGNGSGPSLCWLIWDTCTVQAPCLVPKLSSFTLPNQVNEATRPRSYQTWFWKMLRWRAGYVVNMEGSVVSYLSRKYIYGLNLLSSKHHYLKPGSPSAPGWQYAETIGPLISDHAATLWDYQIWVTFNCCLSHILMVCLLLWYSCGNCDYWKHMASITQPLGTRPFPPPSPTSLHNPQTSCSYLSTVVLPR